MQKSCLILLMWVFGNVSYGATEKEVDDRELAKKIEAENFDNLHQLNDNLYRCEQPSRAGMQELEKLGVKTVFNLRNRMNDRREAKGTALALMRLRINAWRMDYQDVVDAFSMMYSAERPIAIHCLHGSDRTGVIVAAYRMLVDGWPKPMAIREFRSEAFGYNEKWFPKMLVMLEILDIKRLKEDIRLKINQK